MPSIYLIIGIVCFLAAGVLVAVLFSSNRRTPTVAAAFVAPGQTEDGGKTWDIYITLDDGSPDRLLCGLSQDVHFREDASQLAKSFIDKTEKEAIAIRDAFFSGGPTPNLETEKDKS